MKPPQSLALLAAALFLAASAHARGDTNPELASEQSGQRFGGRINTGTTADKSAAGAVAACAADDEECRAKAAAALGQVNAEPGSGLPGRRTSGVVPLPNETAAKTSGRPGLGQRWANLDTNSLKVSATAGLLAGQAGWLFGAPGAVAGSLVGPPIFVITDLYLQLK